jgi:hypothetical protein
LNQLTGVAAILNFPAPHIEDEVEQEQLRREALLKSAIKP